MFLPEVRQQYRIFLSAVSSELREHRQALRASLRRRRCDVRDQDESLRDGEPATLLAVLRHAVRECHAIVHLAGVESGEYPSEPAVDEFRRLLPDGFERLSYTQWELVFALESETELGGRGPRRTAVLLTDDAAKMSQKSDEELAGTLSASRQAQRRWVQWIEERGLYRASFTTPDNLCRQALEQDWDAGRSWKDALPEAKPSNLRAPLGELFKGRVDELDRLEKLLLSDGHHGPAALVQPVATTAMGGAGKTQTAIEFGHRHRDRFSALLFVRADSPETLRRELAGLVGALAIELPPDATDEQRARASLDWLKTHPGWYLVVDNVDTEEARDAVVAQIGKLSAGKVVITSRLRNWPGSVRTLDLGVLLREDSIALLEAWTTRGGRQRPGMGPDPKHPADAADVAKLAETLGDLALALRQAAALIANQGWNVREYLDAWNAAQKEVIATFDAATLEYPRPLATTWLTTWRLLPQSSRRVLQVLSQFGPEPIPRFLFFGKRGDFAGPEERDKPFGLQADAEPLWAELLEGASLREAIASLTDTALATSVNSPELAAGQPGANGLTVHAVVQHVTRMRVQTQDPEMARERRRFAARLPSVILPRDTRHYRTWPIWRPLADHVAAFDRYGLAFKETPQDLAYLLDRLATYYQYQAAYAAAEPFFRRAIAIGEGKLGSDHPVVAAVLNNLAGLLRSKGELDKAEPLFRQALAIGESKLGPDHPDVAMQLNNLGNLLRLKGELDQAEPLFRRALAIGEAKLGLDNPDVAIWLSNLGSLLREKGELDQAELLFRRALAIGEAKLGPDHPDVAVWLNNFAGLLEAKGELDKAELLYRRVIKIDEAAYGLEHPEVATDLNNLAGLLRTKGESEEAERLYRRALTTYCSVSRKLEGLHPHALLAARNYASFLLASGRSRAEIARLIRECSWDDSWGAPPTGE